MTNSTEYTVNQDNKKLAKWFASRNGANQQVMKMFNTIKQQKDSLDSMIKAGRFHATA